MSAKKERHRLKPRPDKAIKDDVLRCTGCGYPIAAGQAQTHNHRGQRLRQPICRSCFERAVSRPTETWDKMLETYVEDETGFHRRPLS